MNSNNAGPATKRILIVSQYFWPEDFRVNELTSELISRGHHVTVLTGRPNYPGGAVYPEYQANPHNFEQFGGAYIIRVPLRARKAGRINLALNYWSFVFWGSLLGPWRLRGKQFDAIFVFETSPITAAIPAILLKKIKGAPITLWVLDLWPDMLRALGVIRGGVSYQLAGLLVSSIYRNCDLILTQSRSFGRSIEKWNRARKPVAYFPQWVEEAYLAPPAEQASELDQFVGKFIVLFAGNVGDCQDFPAILDAAEHLKDDSDVVWIIVGDGRYSDWVHSQIQARGLTHCVKMLGRFPANRMSGFFAAASALLVSLRSEEVFAMTVPGKVQSYLAASKPILAMLDGEGAAVIAESGAGLVSRASDAHGLAANVSRLKSMPTGELKEMGDNGRRYAVAHFEKEKLLDEMLAKMPSRVRQS